MKHETHKKIFGIFTVLAAAIFLTAPQTVFAVASQRTITAYDTIAHFETLLKGSGFFPNEAVTLVLMDPRGEQTELKVVSDPAGKISETIPLESTTTAGTYFLRENKTALETSFQVFPGEMDIKTSSMAVYKSTITVTIVDAFGNPLEGHEVTLISSRAADSIAPTSAVTNELGQASFSVDSQKAGVSVFTATDESAGSTLESRTSVTFNGATSKPVWLKSSVLNASAIGGDTEPVLIAQASSSVASFLIENFPASVRRNEATSFRVSAIDSSGNVVTSYTGTVVFTSTDPNATLPSPYVFSSADQGRKTFSLGVSFATVGTQKLTVYQQGNVLLKGEKAIDVIPSESGPGGSSQVRITMPATGTYARNTMSIEGEAAPNAKVQIYHNGQQVIEVQASGTGRFTYQTSLLVDGPHTFQAKSDGAESQTVSITIDSTPAQVEQVDISKTQLAPGEQTELTIRTDPDAKTVEATVGESLVELEADSQNPGVYQGIITAPAREGSYMINVIITDTLGNPSPAVEVGRITVNAGLTPDGPAVFEVPSKVTGVIPVAGNGRVTLQWNPATAASGIAFYRIYYGTTPGNLQLVVNTTSAATTWYVPNLRNGSTYYFQVVGVDANGNEGDNRSDVVTSVPLSSLPRSDDSPVLCDPEPCPPDASPPPYTPEDGPSVLLYPLAMMVANGVWRVVRKKRK